MNDIDQPIARLGPATDAVPARDAEPLPAISEKVVMGQQITFQAKPRSELNFEALARSGYLTPHLIPIRSQAQKDLVEEYGFLRYWVLQNKKLAESSLITTERISLTASNLMLVTSALSGEGKTFTSFNLAMSIATARDATSVLLVDGDLVGRSLTQLTGLADAPGLTDILLGTQVDLRDVIVSTNVPNLKLLPAGSPYPNAMDLLAAEQMRDLTYELSARYSNRIVLFDTMPLLFNSQVLLLTSLMGILLVVVEEGKTPQKAVKEAVSLLDQNKVIGMILNKCSQKNPVANKYPVMANERTQAE